MSSGFKQVERKSKIKDKKSKLQVNQIQKSKVKNKNDKLKCKNLLKPKVKIQRTIDPPHSNSLPPGERES